MSGSLGTRLQPVAVPGDDNPLLSYSNSLRQRLDDHHAAFPRALPIQPDTSQADAYSFNRNALTSWRDAQRQRDIEAGLIDPETGWPTPAGARASATSLALGLGTKDISTGRVLRPVGGGNALSGVPEAPPAVPGEATTVSTRLPSKAAAAKLGVDPHATNEFLVGVEPYMQPEVAPLRERHGGLITGYGTIPGVKAGMPAEEAIETYINHIKDNASDLYREAQKRWGPDVVKDASQWYEGAHAIAGRLAKEGGLEPQQAAGTIAALSPQKVWDQNVHQGQQVVRIAGEAGADNLKFTPGMKDWVGDYLDYLKKEKKPQAKIDAARDAFNAIKDTPYNDLQNDVQRAMFIRAFDQAHFPPTYQLIHPRTGEPIGLAMTQGTPKEPSRPQKHSWGSFGEIGNAVQAMTGDQRAISDAVGNQHKVRSFYNNISAPLSPQPHITIDTHAIAGGLMEPLGSKSTAVAHGLGTSPEKGIPGASDHAPSGLRGMYPLFHEGFRRAAEKEGLPYPRQMQSVTWEGGRNLFSPEAKRDDNLVSDVRRIWQDAAEGNITPRQARQKIKKRAGGMDFPEWAR